MTAALVTLWLLWMLSFLWAWALRERVTDLLADRDLARAEVDFLRHQRQAHVRVLRSLDGGQR